MLLTADDMKKAQPETASTRSESEADAPPRYSQGSKASVTGDHKGRTASEAEAASGSLSASGTRPLAFSDEAQFQLGEAPAPEGWTKALMLVFLVAILLSVPPAVGFLGIILKIVVAESAQVSRAWAALLIAPVLHLVGLPFISLSMRRFSVSHSKPQRTMTTPALGLSALIILWFVCAIYTGIAAPELRDSESGGVDTNPAADLEQDASVCAWLSWCFLVIAAIEGWCTRTLRWWPHTISSESVASPPLAPVRPGASALVRPLRRHRTHSGDNTARPTQRVAYKKKSNTHTTHNPPPHTPHNTRYQKMTEVDYSVEGLRNYQRTQQRIANWADDTGAQAHRYKNPFLPRSEAEFAGNAFYGHAKEEKSRSSSRASSQQSSRRDSPSSSHGHGHRHSSSSGRKKPERSYTTGGIATQPQPHHARSPLSTAVSPDDSISQVGMPRPSSHHRRARSHSPSRHRSSTSGGGKHHRSGTTTYVVASPQAQGQQYAYAYGYGSPQPVYGYGQQQQSGYFAYPAQQQQQQAAVVVIPRDRRVQIVYPDQQQQTYTYAAHQSQSSGGGGGFLSKLFHRSSESGSGSRRSRSVSRSRR
uniref:Uncharacterized protein n=1 Tax=Mycena chlorophos TaxID=658473 RepID=A0ABQ0L225_MYCCL|nr:predicted protein [Mycena chlorophos]